ncbi:MAG: hypothetical protein LBT64_02215, partial [Puniceicoccales bacterium]|nr:hypothetical protein [Puniceicoccales bacterium]
MENNIIRNSIQDAVTESRANIGAIHTCTIDFGGQSHIICVKSNKSPLVEFVKKIPVLKSLSDH